MPRKLSNHLVYNLSRPDKSLMLLAPLAKEAGGYDICVEDGHAVFAKKSDPGYQAIRALILHGQEELDRDRRFDMPGFQPNQHYLRVMKGVGVLPGNLSNKAKVDSYTTDEAYWRTFWHRP